MEGAVGPTERDMLAARDAAKQAAASEVEAKPDGSAAT